MARLGQIWRYPANFSELTFSLWLHIYNKICKLKFFNWIGHFLKYLFKLTFFFLPYFPKRTPPDDRDLNSDLKTLVVRQYPLFAVSFFVATILSLWAIGFLTFAEDRFDPFDEKVTMGDFVIFNFMDDWANWLLYSVVVPFYVALGAVVWSLSWSFQRQISTRICATTPQPQTVPDGTRPAFAQGKLQTSFWIFASMIFCIYFSISYQSDVYTLLIEEGVTLEGKPSDSKNLILYWFFTNGSHGVTYNVAGYYYIFLNFFLLLSIVFSVLFFLSSAFSVMALQQYIRQGKYANFESLRKDLQRFTLAFVCAKWLFFTYIVNTYIWRESYLGVEANLNATIIAMTIIGSVLLPIPVFLIQNSWYAHEREQFIVGNSIERPDVKSLIPPGWMRISKNAANSLIGATFIESQFGISRILQELGINPVEFPLNWSLW